MGSSTCLSSESELGCLSSENELGGGLGRPHTSEAPSLGVGGHGSELTDSSSNSFAERWRLIFFRRCMPTITAHTKEQMPPTEMPTPMPTCTAKLIPPSACAAAGCAGLAAGGGDGVLRAGGVGESPGESSIPP